MLIFLLFHAFKHVFLVIGVLHFLGQNRTCIFGTALGTCLITFHLSLVGNVSAFLKCVHGDEVDIQSFTCGSDRTATIG